jgi:crotonobetainyl-CoA:carnitine CoA-transferase CaiB-like acyl-CoA transferase
MQLAPQPLGAQSAEILKELGWEESAIEQLARDEIVLLGS